MGDVHDASYYAKCMVGGIFACGITHAAVCPLDIVKCRRQVSVTSRGRARGFLAVSCEYTRSIQRYQETN